MPEHHDLRTTLQRCAVTATPWFAVLDAAQGNAIPGRAQDAGLTVQSLYSGERGAQLKHVAPHLSTFDPNSEFATWMFDHWDGNLGILLQTSAPFETLRKHLKRFLMVKDEAGKRYRFRYYDPRALRAFMPASSAAELKDFFGPVACFYAAGRSGESVCVYSWSANGLASREYPIRRQPAASRRATGLDEGRVTGSLVVTLVDAESGVPIGGASVQATGPTSKGAVSGSWGEVRFEGLAQGQYEVFAVDTEHRMGQGTATVTAEASQLQLACRATTPVEGAVERG